LKKPIRNIAVILIIITAGALLIVPKLLSDKNKSQKTISQNPQNQVTQVDVFIVKPSELENEILTTGTILANEEVEIKSELTRKITGIYFKEGAFVPSGKILFKLDDSDILAQINKLRLDEELLLKQQEREKQLYDKGLLTPDEYEIKTTAIEKIKADIKITEVQLSKTTITAPFSGIAGFRNVSIGSLVNNTMVLTTIQDIGRVKVDFAIPEKYLNQFSQGQEIKFSVEGYEEDFSGRVISYDPQINESTRSIMLRASANNKGSKLLPGSFVKVKLVLEDLSNTMMIPSQAIIPQLKGQSVYLYQNGISVMKEVQIGLRTEKDVQIISGINMNDTVITTNILRLKPEAKVKISNTN